METNARFFFFFHLVHFAPVYDRERLWCYLNTIADWIVDSKKEMFESLTPHKKNMTMILCLRRRVMTNKQKTLIHRMRVYVYKCSESMLSVLVNVFPSLYRRDWYSNWLIDALCSRYRLIIQGNTQKHLLSSRGK